MLKGGLPVPRRSNKRRYIIPWFFCRQATMRVIPLVLALRCKGGVELSFLGTRASRTHVYQGGQDGIVEGVANSFGTVISGAAIMIAVAAVFSMMHLSWRFGGEAGHHRNGSKAGVREIQLASSSD